MFGVADKIDTTVLQLLREALPSRSAKMEIRPEMSLQRDLGIDSMALVAFAVRLGDEFGIDLNQFADAIGDTRTVDDVLVTVKRLVEQSKVA
jgi:acyl carrier protein